jgi:hypothetical protein
MVAIATWTYYLFTDRTAVLFGGLSGYSSGSISVDQAKELVKSNIVQYIMIIVAASVTYVLTVGGGRVLATLYTRRQLIYLARLLLDSSLEENDNNLLYHSRHISVIPHFLSHDIAQLNTEIFNFIFGHIYYAGIISKTLMSNLKENFLFLSGQGVLCIILSVLLGQQNGGSTGNMIIYLTVFGLFFIMSILSALFNKWSTLDESQFIEFVNAHKRINSQAEQIAFSGDDVCQAEENQLRMKLDSSVYSQIHSGFFFSIIIGIVKLSLSNVYLIGYAIPAAIFFYTYYDKGVADPRTAQTFITLSVYMTNLYAPLSVMMYYGDPIRRIQSIGIRVVGYLGK